MTTQFEQFLVFTAFVTLVAQLFIRDTMNGVVCISALILLTATQCMKYYEKSKQMKQEEELKKRLDSMENKISSLQISIGMRVK